MKKQITVTRESSSGRNESFRDNKLGVIMTRAEFVKQIEKGNYGTYHVRIINGVKTPCSNPDGNTSNNLG